MEERLQRIKVLLGASTALALAACSGAAQLPPKTSSVNDVSPSYAKLQFAVGTANIYGTATGLNVVSTYRQTNGKSAVLVDTPSITGPFALPAAACAGNSGLGDGFATFAGGENDVASEAATSQCAPGAAQDKVPGPSFTEVTAGGELTGTTQSLRLGSVACDSATYTFACPAGYTPNTSTFGQSGGVFAMGLQPANSTNSGTPYSYAPYSEPIFDASGDEFVPWGGPPAYDPDGHGSGARDGINNLGAIDGVNEGLTTFEGVTPGAGTYTLSLQVPTGISSTGTAAYGTVTATSTLTSVATLGTAVAPVLNEDRTGGGSLTVVLPPGATEGIIQISDYGPISGTAVSEYSCQGPLSPLAGAGPVIYTLVVHASGIVTLPDAVGPNLDSGEGSNKFLPGPTLCTAAQNQAAATAAGDTTDVQVGDEYSVQLVATDYPAYEANPIFGGETPTIVGANGQADISISTPIVNATYGDGGGPANFAAYKRHPARKSARPGAAVKRAVWH